MAGDWIKIRSNIKDDPDVIILAEKLGIDEFGTVGRLHAVWAWLDQHSKTGTNVRISSAYLDRLTACLGFAEGMRAVGWLCGRDGDLEFPRFERHNGDSAKNRAADSKRKQEGRDSKDEFRTNVRKDPDKCPKKTGPEKRREEESIEERNNPIAGAEALCTIEQAKAYAPSVKFTEADAERWWHTRNASGWTKGSVNGGAARRITSWQSDMATSAGWVKQSASYGQAKGRPQHFAGIVENLEIPT